MDDWLEREVRTEVERRARNEWIEETTDRFDAGNAVEAFVCECSDHSCASTIDLSRDEYESVRSQAQRFAIARDHEDPQTDRVVAENDRFAVVEKWLGFAKRIAVETDPRGAFRTQDG